MTKRFALIWLALCGLSMGAHALVAPHLPTMAGLVATAILLMPLAALSARVRSAKFLGCAATVAQMASHLTLQLSAPSSQTFYHHAHGSTAFSQSLIGVPEMADPVWHLSAQMLALHVIAAAITAKLLYSADAFLAALDDFFARCFATVSVQAFLAPRSTLVSPEFGGSQRVELWYRAVPRRGPPILD